MEVPAIVIAELVRSLFGIVETCEYVSVAVAFTYPAPVRADIDVSPASLACLFQRSVVRFVTALCGIPVKFASLTPISTSSFAVSSVIVTLLLLAFIFLNCRSTHTFVLYTHTHAVPTFEAVFASPPPHHGRFDTVTFLSVQASLIRSSSVPTSEVFAVLLDIAVGSTVRAVEPVTSPV